MERIWNSPPRVTWTLTRFLREWIWESCLNDHLWSTYFTGLVPSIQLFKCSACLHFLGKVTIIFIRNSDVVIRSCSVKIVLKNVEKFLGKQRRNPNLRKMPKKNDILKWHHQSNLSEFFRIFRLCWSAKLEKKRRWKTYSWTWFYGKCIYKFGFWLYWKMRTIIIQSLN